jgi:hypothetical protein
MLTAWLAPFVPQAASEKTPVLINQISLKKKLFGCKLNYLKKKKTYEYDIRLSEA